ncbi:uncharacterized protein METZ01_LOCUS351358, partial [marine metagenome]
MKLLNQIGFSIYSDIWAICYEPKQ